MLGGQRGIGAQCTTFMVSVAFGPLDSGACPSTLFGPALPSQLASLPFCRRHASWLDGPVHISRLSTDPPLPHPPSLPLHAAILLAGDMPQAHPYVIKAVLASCEP